MFSISLRSEFSPDKAAEQMSRFPGICNVEMWGECVSASKAGCGFSVVHPPSWPEPTHGNVNIKSCTSAPKCTWWIFFRYRCSKQHKAGVIWPLFLHSKWQKQNRSQRSSHQIAQQTMVKITVDTIWRLCFSPESVKMCTKLRLWSDPFTMSEIPPSQNASCSSPWVIFSTSTSSSLEFYSLCRIHRHQAAGHLYDVFLSSVRVLEISCPFFIQKLSLWGVWEVVRLHSRVTGFRAPSARMIWSDELIFGSARQRQSNLITEPGLKAS